MQGEHYFEHSRNTSISSIDSYETTRELHVSPLMKEDGDVITQALSLTTNTNPKEHRNNMTNNTRINIPKYYTDTMRICQRFSYSQAK